MEDWEFEPETYLMQAMEFHYDGTDCDHIDSEYCAIRIVEWLRNNGVTLVHSELHYG